MTFQKNLQKRKTNRPDAINAGSMADIAFLLLIFFLVSTSMDMDKGIQVMLPPWTDIDITVAPFPERNVLEILVNGHDQLMIERELAKLGDIKDLVITHLNNNGLDPDFADSADDAIVSLQNHDESSYNVYISVYNEIKAAYNTVRDQEALVLYKLPYESLTEEQKKGVREKYPIRLSESPISNKS